MARGALKHAFEPLPLAKAPSPHPATVNTSSAPAGAKLFAVIVSETDEVVPSELLTMTLRVPGTPDNCSVATRVVELVTETPSITTPLPLIERVGAPLVKPDPVRMT